MPEAQSSADKLAILNICGEKKSSFYTCFEHHWECYSTLYIYLECWSIIAIKFNCIFMVHWDVQNMHIVVECDDVENISIDFLRNFGSGWEKILSYNLILSYLVYTCSNSFVIAL